MALIDDYNVTVDSDFQYRVQAALVSTALAIQAEATNTAFHQERSAYALRVLADPVGYSKLMALGFTVDGSANLSTTDANLKTRASAIFNAYCVQT